MCEIDRFPGTPMWQKTAQLMLMHCRSQKVSAVKGASFALPLDLKSDCRISGLACYSQRVAVPSWTVLELRPRPLRPWAAMMESLILKDVILGHLFLCQCDRANLCPVNLTLLTVLFHPFPSLLSLLFVSLQSI